MVLNLRSLKTKEKRVIVDLESLNLWHFYKKNAVNIEPLLIRFRKLFKL